MADWSRPFEDPITLPDGRTLSTLRDAGDYITSSDQTEGATLKRWGEAAHPQEKPAGGPAGSVLRRRERSLPGSLLSLSHVIHKCLGQLLRGLRRRLRILPDKIVHRLFDDLPEHIGVFHPFGKGIARAVRRGQNLYGLCLGLCCGHLRHPNNLSRSLRDEPVDGFGSAARPRVCAAALHRARHLDPIGRRTIMCMLLIAALAIVWNVLGGR